MAESCGDNVYVHSFESGALCAKKIVLYLPYTKQCLLYYLILFFSIKIHDLNDLKEIQAIIQVEDIGRGKALVSAKKKRLVSYM